MPLKFVDTKPCWGCSSVDRVVVEKRDYEAWKNGKLAQSAFPYLSDVERERLISGTCPSCWIAAFGSEEW